MPILCYHSVVEGAIPAAVAPGGLHVPMNAFRRQVEYLCRHYRIVPVHEVPAWLEDPERCTAERPAAITFDDGYANTLTAAVPVLRAHGIVATVFLPTDYVDAGGVFWWDELPLLLESARGRMVDGPVPWGRLDLRDERGMTRAREHGAALLACASTADRKQLLTALRDATRVPLVDRDAATAQLRIGRWEDWRAASDILHVGGHSAGHRLLDRLTGPDLEDDLGRCAGRLREECGTLPPLPFCYPAGRHSPDVVHAVEAAGFAVAVTAEPRVSDQSLARSGDPSLLLPRIGVSAGMTLAGFALAVAGARDRRSPWRTWGDHRRATGA